MGKETSYKEIKMIMEANDDVLIKEVRQGGNFRCPIYLRETDSKNGIEMLDLSVRSYNCLKRAGFNSMEDVFSKIHGKEDLLKIRNCGHKSVQEILEKMFIYQFMSVPENKRVWYIEETIKKSCVL